jgi:hypothetical protein
MSASGESGKHSLIQSITKFGPEPTLRRSLGWKPYKFPDSLFCHFLRTGA